jgi:hypothetical protein
MKLDPGMHIGMHLVSFGKSGVTGLLTTQRRISEGMSGGDVVVREISTGGQSLKMTVAVLG